MTDTALSQQVTELVRKLFGRHKDEPLQEAAHPFEHGAAPAAVAVAAAPPPESKAVVGSKLQLIGLARVRAVLGDRWTKLADRVRSIARGIVEKNLLPGDVFEQLGDDGFLVLFAQLSPEDARFKCAAICRQIERHLIGCNLTEVSDCAYEVMAIDAGRALCETVPSEHGAIQPESSAMPQVSSAEPPRQTVAQRAVPAESQDVNLVPEVAIHRMQWRPIGASGQHDQFHTGDQTVHSATAKIEPRPGHKELADDQWRYRPIWDFQRSALMTFALTPVRALEEQEEDADDEHLFRLDNAALAKALHDLDELSHSGRRLPILARIHYGTIVNNRRWAPFIDKLKHVAVERRKLISFEIQRCPHDGLTLSLTHAIAAARGLGVHVALRVDADWRDFRAIERCGIWMATMDASHAAFTEAVRINVFEKYAERTHTAKLDCGMWGLNTRSMVVAAASAGIRHLAGSAIAEEVLSLSNALRFSPVDLYMRR